MKMSVNVEATDEEIRSLAADVARRGIVYCFQYADEALSRIFTPENTQSLLSGIVAAVPGVQKMYQEQIKQRQPPRAGPGYGPPQGPFGGLGIPVSYPGPVANVPRPNVVPFPGSDAVLKSCLPIEETRNNEAAWACCQCGTPNSTARAECRICKHRPCVPLAPPIHPIVTPPPDGSGPNPPAAS